MKEFDSFDIRKPMQRWERGVAQSITFILTEDCQLRCRYCYICGKNSFHVMNFETAKKAVDKILTSYWKMYQTSSVVWEFIGGEPCLEIELLDQICDYIKIRMFELDHPWFENYRFNFATNGLMYDDPRVQNYILKNKTHLSLGISLDGDQPMHDAHRVFPDGTGSYDQVAKQIPLWIRQFGFVTTKATIGREGLTRIRESVLHLWNLGIDEVAMNCVFEDVWQEGDDDILEEQMVALADDILASDKYKQLKCSLFDRTIGFPMDPDDNKNWCGAGKMLAVGTDGKLYPCVRFVAYSLSNRDEIVLGNVDGQIDHNRLRPFLSLNRTVQSPQKCIDCNVASGCAWCQGNNYDVADTPTVFQRAVHICKMHKARVRANNYLWNRLDRLSPPEENDERTVRLNARKGLKYLIVITDSQAPSFCYYNSEQKNIPIPQTMTVDTMKKIVYFALTNNLALNVVTSGKHMSEEFTLLMESCPCAIIEPYQTCTTEDVKDCPEGGDSGSSGMATADFADLITCSNFDSAIITVRIALDEMPDFTMWLVRNAKVVRHVNLIVKDIDTMVESDLDSYKGFLDQLAEVIILPEMAHTRVSIVSDRMSLCVPNQCNAGVTHVTISPDGGIYLCPGFYYDDPVKNRISDLEQVIKSHQIPIQNPQLLQLDHAPICQKCDAYQCRRCLWLNHRTTGEVNTPSRQQCVCAHLERNTSRSIALATGVEQVNQTIPEIDYLDPFDVLIQREKENDNVD